MGKITYKPIGKQEIKILEENACTAADWKTVYAAQGFDPTKVRNVVFEGEVKLGALKDKLLMPDGVVRESGLANAVLCNVTMGNECFIAQVRGKLSNLEIGERVGIEDVGTIACTRQSTFGNGYEIEVLNEGGGRELKITERTNAQIAYLTVLYRDKKPLIKKLNKMADDYAQSVKSKRASIGNNVRVINCGEILNVCIRPHAEINGAQSLKNGTIDSSQEAPTVVGNGVIALDFIFQKGSSVKDGAMIAASLVGEGTKIGKQFSAENSLFFANSEGFHSEACSIFAGPYSVTHHRSTLLIAAMFSFYNAGSGTNQSNHMYKLGPLHQGILERGSKTGSFSYLLWPSRIGAFTAVIGKHYANFDTSDFPFSYVNEEEGRSTLVPGMNFFTVGTLRDEEKWPSRDRRKNSDKLDLIIFNVLSPYTSQKMIRGHDILTRLHEEAMKASYENPDRKPEYVTHKGVHIKRLLLKTCRRYYKLIVSKYFGDVVVKRAENKCPADLKSLFKADPQGVDGSSEWVDLSGLLCAKPRVDALVSDITAGKVDSIESLQKALQAIYDVYEADEWNWILTNYQKVNGKDLAEESNENLSKFLEGWKTACQKLINMVLNDAEKEFDQGTRIGFGIDGNTDQDFEAVRGTFVGNKFVLKLKADMETINKRHQAIAELIK